MDCCKMSTAIAAARVSLSIPEETARYTYGRRRSTPVPSKPAEPPTLTPPRSLRTLGSMKIERTPLRVGRIDFTTPAPCNFDLEDQDLNSFPESFKSKATVSTSLVTELQSIRRIVPDSHYRIYEIIFGWLSGLLSSTEPLEQTAHPKSLLGMCLRKVPDALAVIEEWDRQTAALEGKSLKWDSSKASIELYEQLEGFGSTSVGWKSLKLVVRAHAVSMLTEAVTEGLFEPPFVRLLADLCLSLECRAEAGRLVSSLKLPLTAPCGSASTLLEYSEVQPLGAILRSLQGQGTIGPSWCCLSTLIKAKKLPPSWLTSRAFQSVWMRGIEIILHRRTPVAPVVDFMCTAINQLLLEDRKAMKMGEASEDETLTNVLAAVAAATWTLGAEMNDKEPWKVHSIRRLLFILESCAHQQESRRGTSRNRGLLIVVLARFLAAGMIDKNVVSSTTKNHAIYDCLKLLIRNGVPTQTQYRQTLLLACSVAQYRGQASRLPCHDILSEIRMLFNELGLPDWFQNGLISDGAFVLAQRTRDLRDVAFAERLPAAGKGTLETSTIFSGWCWEEGIGEWVLPSPGQKPRSELRRQNHLQNGTRYQASGDQPDSRARTSSLRGARVVYSNSLRYGSDEDSSAGSERGAENHDGTDDTDREDENDTSATSMTDFIVRDGQDSEDELGEYFPPSPASKRDLSIGKRNVNGNSVKTLKRLDITRTWQATRLYGSGGSVAGKVEDDTDDDELSILL
ncbi:hypothetical protein FPOA_07478 [Fusarium poae]|uniref:Uncharacterized protein n=1 Tax=Fusarium poae TaxID=36050 RepID=A0A1B8AKM9_FUSPO|nr:hypothetical protein FPOA_07478 [Fusarium poae]